MVSKQDKISIFEPGRSWWVVFKKAENPYIRAITCKEIGHCFALTQMNNVVLMIEPLMGTVNHVITDDVLSDILARFKLEGYRVVHFRHTPEPKILKIRTPMITCASYIAYTIGISFFGVTAKQLYRKLLRMGGEEI